MLDRLTEIYLPLLRCTGITLHRYHARVCGFRSGVTLPELLKMLAFNIAVLKCSKDCVYFITLGKLFQILGVLMKNECLNSSVLADFNLYFLLVSRVRESALSSYPFYLMEGYSLFYYYYYYYSNINLFIFLLFSKDDRSIPWRK